MNFIISGIFAFVAAVNLVSVAGSNAVKLTPEGMCAAKFPQTNWCSSSSSSSVPPAPATPDNSNKKCARQLEQIIYIPPNAAKDYLNTLMDQLQNDLSAGNANMQSSISSIKVFVNKYNVWVALQMPFPVASLIYKPGQNNAEIGPVNFGQLVAPTYLNMRSFQATSVDGKIERYSMATFINNPDKNSFTLTISTNASNHLFFKCN